MDLILTRVEHRPDGVFSELKTPRFEVIFHCVEHAYENNMPKIPDGTYTCKRGMHRLHTGPAFETFEVMGVPGRFGILFHVGNWHSDSEGCILVGMGIAQSKKGQMVVQSKDAFADFMRRQQGLDSFTLTVES